MSFCLYVTLISLESELETYGEINLKKSHKPALWEKIMARVNTEKKRGVSDSLYISDWWAFWIHFFLNKFYWSIVLLQCCVSCYCPAKWIIYVIHMSPSFLDFSPIQVITEHWVEGPVLFSGFSLVTYLIHSVISVYVPTPVSWFISFPFSPLASVRLFCMSLCLFLLLNKIVDQINHHRQMTYCTRKTFRLIT